MRNILGSPVTGNDFFDRPKILADLDRDFCNQANLLMVAPRRVGKTSLVLRFCEKWRAVAGQKAIFLQVEGKADEFAFAEALIEELAREGLHPDRLTRAKDTCAKIRKVIGGGGIKVSGLEFSLGEAADGDHSTLEKVLKSVFRGIEEDDKSVLIAIDELPEFLLTLSDAEDGPRRVTAFLHWLRELRQSFRSRIRWLFLGSIGLDNFVEAQKLQKLINDLQIFPLDAFSADEADAFLKKLGASNGLELDPSQREEVIKRLGWPLAYHLHLVFHELREIEPRSVANAIDSLLQPQRYPYFDTWHQRIDEQFPVEDAGACKAILRELCGHPHGRDRDEILAVLASKPGADVDKVEERLSRLLVVLERDGYLLRSESKYAFRSFLLREYWRRRHGK